MSHDNLGDRIKRNYEDISRVFLPRRIPMILRVDGKAFHTLTADMKRPWDEGMSKSMLGAAKFLCENIQNAKLAYVQSDEISVLLTDYDYFNTEAWFDRNLQKMVSVSAAMASVAFNANITKYYPDKFGIFDSRAFVIPREEVCNYFLWRQNDATRNSVQMLARAHFSHKELQNLNNSQIQDKLMLEKGIDWNNTPPIYKRGACIKKNEFGNWIADFDIPVFSQERDYINNLLIQKEE